MIDRRLARELALQALFQKEFSPPVNTQDFLSLFENSVDRETILFSDSLVAGVLKNQSQIDAQIQSVSTHWKLDRMSAVDRQLLRVATYEMIFANPAIKPGIAINEAIEIAKKFGTSESASFINGILDQLRREKGWE